LRADAPVTNNVVTLPLPDEVQLVARARGGDRRSFELLVVKEMPHIVRLLTRLLGSDADVSVMANEVLMVGWAKLRRVREDVRFGSFVAGVCVNVARNQLRSQRRRRWLVLGLDGVTAETAPREDGREALQATYKVLNTLDEELRLAFALRYIDGRDLSETADLLGVSLATVKRRLHRAEHLFVERARRHPALEAWVAQSPRWGDEQ